MYDRNLLLRSKIMVTGEDQMSNYSVKGNFEYKRELAHKLIKLFGVTAARQNCIENK